MASLLHSDAPSDDRNNFAGGPVYFKFKYTVAKLILDLTRTIFEHRYQGPRHFGAEADACMIAFAIVIGHYEGRPMTANKIAQYLQIPRRTVARKLEFLCEIGYATKDRTKYYVNRNAFLDTEDERAHTRDLFQIIHVACQTLTELRKIGQNAHLG